MCLKALLITLLVYVGMDEMMSIQHLSSEVPFFTSVIKQILELGRTGRTLKDVSVITGKQIVKNFPCLILQNDGPL